jgi:hypothetical protein
MRITVLFFIITFWPALLSGQIVIGDQRIDMSKVKPWLTGQIQDYQSEYHFGFSGGESYFILIVTSDSCYAQYQYFSFDQGLVKQFVNLKNVRIEGNKFFSDQTNGEFVIYEYENKLYKGLMVYSPWSNEPKNGEYEIGSVRCSLDIHFEGNYTSASWRLLCKDELEMMTLSDLQKMRNEIYARYGYIFKSGGENDKYFKSQSWYGGRLQDVSNLLTGLEKRNISLILTIEKIKNGL